MKEIDVATLPKDIMLAHRETLKGQPIIEAWKVQKTGGLKYLTEFRNAKIVYRPSNSLDIDRQL